MSTNENSTPETQQLKSAPKTKLNQAIKAIRKIARSTDANDISFLCDFVLNNYSDVIDEWNSKDTQEGRDWLYGEARKSIASKIKQEELDEIIESVKASSPAKELEKEVTYSLGIAAITYKDVDLKKAFTEQQAQKRA